MKSRKILFAILLIIIFSIPMLASASIFASEYIDRCHASINIQTNGDMNLRFSINACKNMTKLGAKTIVLQERANSNAAWSEIETYSYEDYPEMLTLNASYYNSKVTYCNAKTGYQYRIKVYFYAENGGYDTAEYITNPVTAK